MVFYLFQIIKLFYERYSFCEQMQTIKSLVFSFFYHNLVHLIININLVYYMNLKPNINIHGVTNEIH
jgi:hypothetical protein